MLSDQNQNPLEKYAVTVPINLFGGLSDTFKILTNFRLVKMDEKIQEGGP